MKKIYSFALASLAAVLSFLFLSCDFFNPAESGKDVSGVFTLSGSLVTDINQNADAFPSGFLDASGLDSAAASSREAFPSYVTDALYYSVSCSNETATFEGKVDSSDPSNLTFKVDVPSGSSTVTAKAFIDKAKTKQVYGGTLLLQDVKEDSDLSGRTIELSDIHSGTEKTATVSLPISIKSGTKISKISATVMKDNASFGSGPLIFTVSEGKTYYFSFSDNLSEQFSETQAAEANSVPGVYDVEFSFFAGDSASSSGEYLAFWTKQKIIASNYLSTENWNGNGADSCINADNNILEVTEKICKEFLSDTFYIDSSSGSDSGSGSFSSPFKTIQKAVNVIQSLGKTESCTVFLKGDITADQDSDCADGSFVKIADSANLTLVIKAYPSGSAFSINANGRGRVLYIGSGNNVTLKNVTLEKGNARDSDSQGGTNGGAVYVGGNGTLSLENCTVSSCVADGNGGAIYVGGSGSNIELKNCTIGKENDQISALKEGAQNKTYAPDSDSNSNYAKGSGGGIYGENNANIQILSTKIVNCYSGGNGSSFGGGGIYLDSAVCKIDDTLSDNNYQSEIYANGSASARGVGIYAGNSSILTLGGSVHHNYTTVLSGVPGIYLNDGSTLNLKEHSEIRDNYSEQSVTGAGIFVSGNNCSVNLQGGTVENNSSLNGSYFATDIGYTSSITDAVINISGSSYIGSISSQSAPINIDGNITGFSSDKTCKIYTQITEDKTILQATSENVNLSSFADYFKLYDLSTRTEATEYKLSVDSSGSPQVAKIVKENSSQGGGNSGSESQTLAYLYENKNSVSVSSGAEYTVSSELELFYLSSLVNDGIFTFENATVKQTSDITLSTYSNWTPIGTSSASPFSGTFDGQNNKITGLAIEATESHRALFGYTSDANLKNINISGSITASGVTLQYIAGVVGEFTQKTGTALSEITNCTSSVSISFTGGSSELVGGIAGKIAANDTIKITNCAFNGTISASGMSKIGGIAGQASYNVIFYNCENSGTIYAQGNAGGIFGYGQANKNGTQYELPSVKNCVCNVALSNISVRTSGGLIGNYNATDITDAFADYSYYITSSTSDYQSIGTTSYTDKDTVFKFSSDGTKGTLSGGTQDVGSKTDLTDIVEALNAWITESTFGNDSSFATYKQWSYNSSGLPTILAQ